MKTNELKQKLENIGLMFEDDLKDILISNEWGNTVCSISKEYVASFNIDWFHSSSISENKRKDLIKIVTEYSLTPIEEREITQKVIPILNLHENAGFFVVNAWYSNDTIERSTSYNSFQDYYNNRYVNSLLSPMIPDGSRTMKEWETYFNLSKESLKEVYEFISVEECIKRGKRFLKSKGIVL